MEFAKRCVIIIFAEIIGEYSFADVLLFRGDYLP